MKYSQMRIVGFLFAGGLLPGTGICAEPVNPADPTTSPPAGEAANFDVWITQDMIKSGNVPLDVIFQQGMQVFTTPFNRYDGLGDGHLGARGDRAEEGKRPSVIPSSVDLPYPFPRRVNGSDAQACLECHFVGSNDEIPARFLVGGVGGVGATAMPMGTEFDIADQQNNGHASFNGRVINPPFVFGSGGLELLAMEMTTDLHAIKAQAKQDENIGQWYDLETHGINFGKIRWVETPMTPDEKIAMEMQSQERFSHNCNPVDSNLDQGDRRRRLAKEIEDGTMQERRRRRLTRMLQTLPKRHAVDLRRFIDFVEIPPQWAPLTPARLQKIQAARPASESQAQAQQSVGLLLDVSQVKGVSNDLIVRPFGRKGNNVTTRDFDCGAMRFHQGMEPDEILVELSGSAQDHDNDGYIEEVTVGQMSALAIFNTTTRPPTEDPQDEAAQRGATLFDSIGCASCHKPEIKTQGRVLSYHYPEFGIGEDIFSDDTKYYEVDLTLETIGFTPDDGGDGIKLRAFTDLKLHDMGYRLRENLPLQEGETALERAKKNRTFITARLWGVADTGPYLHDGRATTLSEAILLHGGEALNERNAFAGLSDDQRTDLLKFLRTLRTPDAL